MTFSVVHMNRIKLCNIVWGIRGWIGFPLLLVGTVALFADGLSIGLNLLGKSGVAELNPEKLWIGVPVDLLLALTGGGLLFRTKWWHSSTILDKTVDETERREDRQRLRRACGLTLGLIGLYLFFTGPLCWLAWKVALPESAIRAIQWVYLPLRWIMVKSNLLILPLIFYTRLWFDDNGNSASEFGPPPNCETPQSLSALASLLLGAGFIFGLVRWTNRQAQKRLPNPPPDEDT